MARSGWCASLFPGHRQCLRYPAAWVRYWFVASAFGNLVWYILGSILSVVLLYSVRHGLGRYVPHVEAGAAYALRIATTENVSLAYTLTLFMLGANLCVSVAYRLLVEWAMSQLEATYLPGMQQYAKRLRKGMALRAIDKVYWVRRHDDIHKVVMDIKAVASRRSATSASSGWSSDPTNRHQLDARMEAFSARVYFVVQLYYNPLSLRMFVHSVFCVAVLMALKTGHHLNQDGLAALPFTLFIGVFFSGVLLFIRIADSPFFDDGASPRLHAFSKQDLRLQRSEASVREMGDWTVAPTPARELGNINPSTRRPPSRRSASGSWDSIRSVTSAGTGV